MNSPFVRRSIRKKSVLLLLAVMAIATTLLMASTNPGIAPPNSKPLGTSYAGWGAAWWQWVFSLPANVPLHPVRATGEVDCSYGQDGQVWFLAGTLDPGTTLRSCKVPTGTRLFFPVFNAWADNVAEPEPYTIEELEERAAAFSEASELHASIDGVPVPMQDLLGYRAGTPFSYTVPVIDNLLQFFGADVPGSDWNSTFVSPAASDGYWLMLQPLNPGVHVINFGGTSLDGSFPNRRHL